MPISLLLAIASIPFTAHAADEPVRLKLVNEEAAAIFKLAKPTGRTRTYSGHMVEIEYDLYRVNRNWSCAKVAEHNRLKWAFLAAFRAGLPDVVCGTTIVPD